MMKKLVFALAIFGFSGVADAVIIVDQTWDGNKNATVAQDFPDFPDFSTFEFDDFSVAGPGFFVTALNAVGRENGDMSFNIAVIGEIWDGLPGIFGGNIVMSTTAGVENGDGSVTLDFGGQALGPGDYWITLYVVRPFADGGQWFWNRTNANNPNGSEQYFYNPGGGFGFGTDPLPGSKVFDFDNDGFPDNIPADLNFVLEGDLIPAPGALALLGLAGLAARRRRRA